MVGVSSGRSGFSAIAETAEMLQVDDFAQIADMDGSIWERFGVISQPASILVDSEGRVTAHMGSLRSDGLSKLLAKATLDT